MLHALRYVLVVVPCRFSPAFLHCTVLCCHQQFRLSMYFIAIAIPRQSKVEGGDEERLITAPMACINNVFYLCCSNQFKNNNSTSFP